MNLRQIEVFRTIMMCQSVTDAARLLNVSQPTLTKVLRHAEDQLGFKLFRRAGGRLHATEEARLLFPDVERIFREIQSLQRLSADLREGTAGLLRVGATASLALSVVPDALEIYRHDYPGVRIISFLLAGRDIGEMIMAHQLDIAISVAPVDVPSAHVEPVQTAEFICIMPEHHPLASRKVVTPRDVAEHTLISYSGATPVGRLLEDAFRRSGVRRQIDIEVSLSPLACVLVQRGLGVALVDGFIPRLAFPGIVARKFRPRTLQQVSLITPPVRSRFADAFVPCLQRAFAVASAVP